MIVVEMLAEEHDLFKMESVLSTVFKVLYNFIAFFNPSIDDVHTGLNSTVIKFGNFSFLGNNNSVC